MRGGWWPSCHRPLNVSLRFTPSARPGNRRTPNRNRPGPAAVRPPGADITNTAPTVARGVCTQARVSKPAPACSGVSACMPCSFGPPPSRRSAMCAQFKDPLRVTVVIRWIPLVTAPSGTRMARRAVRGRLSSRYPCLGWRGSSTTRWQELVAQMMAPLASIGGSASMKAPSTTSCQAT